MPKFSVIIPLYNKELIIAKSIRSVLFQTYGDFELIIVDDGSLDCSLDIVRSIHDKRIRVIQQKNGGPSKARNVGIKKSIGEWILFLDADDELLPNALLYFSEAINDYPQGDFICAPFYTNGIFEGYSFSNGIINNPCRKHYFGELPVRTGSSIYKRELIKGNLFNEKIRRYEDFELWLRLYRKASVYSINRPVLSVNQQYATASSVCKFLKDDFLGNMHFKGVSFWERMCLYKLYRCEKNNYGRQLEKLYGILKYRYDLLFVYKLLNFLYYHVKF